MSVKDETAKGALWGLIMRLALSPSQFVFGILLARLITPDEMGIVALTSIFFAVAAQLQNAGLGSALIRKQDRTDEDINTVFWFNVSMSLFLSSCLFAAAPWFASFFNQPPLVNLTRVSAIMMFLQSTCSVHWSLLSAARAFKPQCTTVIITNLVPMPFTIWAAFAGWSYWALMLQGVLNGLLNVCIIWYISSWKPRFVFSWASFRELFGFSSRLTLAGLIGTIQGELQTFIIGKFYSAADLALFSRGWASANFPVKFTLSLLGGIIFPVLSTLQNDMERLLRVYREYIRLTSMCVVWGMITMSVNSYAFIYVLYGERWIACAIYTMLLSLSLMFSPLSSLNATLHMVLGRSDITLRKEVILRTFSTIALIVGAWYSVMGVCIAAVLTGWLTFAISIFLTSKICPLRMWQQVADILPYLFMAVIANIPAFFITQTDWHPLIKLLSGGTSSFLIYLLIIIYRKDSSSMLLYGYLKEKFLAKFSRHNQPSEAN